ncbi:MAG: nuclear transport factor 2 family protein [Gaiellaceae bacterium]
MNQPYDYEALILRYFLAVDEERLDDVVACFCEDATFDFPLAEQPVRGHKELREFFAAHTGRFSDHVDRVTRVLVDGDAGISELVFDATTTDGLTVHLENCNVYRFRDGRFAAVKVYGDSVEIRRQFGLA